MSIEEIVEEVTAYRRLFHQHPQTAYEEEFISNFVADRLTEWGIPFERGIGKTGIVATIEGRENSSGKAIGLRCDMDALDITEVPNKEWASTIPGKMHACGHDGHTSIMLGAAKALSNDPAFNGKVHLIFQPAEEGSLGAHAMIEDGLFERFPCDQIFALHNWPHQPRGHFGTRAGPIMSASSRFTITITGLGGHAAEPEKTVDPIVISSQIIMALQTLVSRNINPSSRIVISVTNFEAGTGAFNIIPGHAVLKGSIRNFRRETRLDIVQQMEDLVTLFGGAMGADIDFDYAFLLDTTNNDEAAAALCTDVARGVLGLNEVDGDIRGLMISEDFGEMLKHVPGAYVFLGQGEPDDLDSNHNHGLHTPEYDFNDKIIPIGIEYWMTLTRACLPL